MIEPRSRFLHRLLAQALGLALLIVLGMLPAPPAAAATTACPTLTAGFRTSALPLTQGVLRASEKLLAPTDPPRTAAELWIARSVQLVDPPCRHELSLDHESALLEQLLQVLAEPPGVELIARRERRAAALYVLCRYTSRPTWLTVHKWLAASSEEILQVQCTQRIFADYGSDLNDQRLDYVRKLARRAAYFAQPFLPATFFSEAEKDLMGPILTQYDLKQWPGRDALYGLLCLGREPSQDELREACAHHRVGQPLQLQLNTQNLAIGSLTSREKESLAATLTKKWQEDNSPWERVLLRRNLCVAYKPQTVALQRACAGLPSEQADLPVWNAELNATILREVLDHERESRESGLWVGTLLSLCAVLIYGLVRMRLHALEEERRQRQLSWSGIA